MSREQKTLHFDVKATGITTTDEGQEIGHISCYTAVFNNVDEGNDRILPGAFTRTIQNSKSRAKARGKKYLLPMLWNHDPNELIGGWTSMIEDDFGLKCEGDVLLATQRGREYYALAKQQMSDEFSIIYDIPQGGSKYDKSGVRELGEIRLFSNDPVVFAMNDATYMIGVKSMEQKTITGNTSGPIGPRDEAWDSSKAEKQIWQAAYDEDTGKINTTLAKKYFMVVDGDAQKKGSYSYPFWYIGDSPHICVGAVKAIAGAISGSRGASAPDGLKAKVEKLYKRINSKYPDDPELTPPWEDGKSMNRQQRRQRKTFEEHYNDEAAQDLLEDWSDIWLCSLTCAVFDAFTIGDQPASDISEAIDAFKESVMSKFIPQAQDCDLSAYLSDNAYSYTPGLSTMQNGSSGGYGYGYMSRSTRELLRKAGRSISAANQSSIDDHVSNLHDMANKAMKAMKDHTNALHDAADAFAEKMAGNQADSDNKPDDQTEKSFNEALRELKALRA